MEEQLQPNPNSVTGLTGSSPPLHHDDDGEPVLSSHTLAALNEFLAEQQRDSAAGDSEVSLVSEDWRLSQFWYSAETATTVAQEVLTLCAAANSRVACIACPTLYAYLKNMDPGVSVQLLEYDKRFEQLKSYEILNQYTPLLFYEQQNLVSKVDPYKKVFQDNKIK
ncbi:EEF1A lysine methyltransferase 1-like [Cajanus cajan]|uniref:EEF1A lysine methyltransferase 1-like n=1 Tax=Cajanus cajan TaxID=3821 RepID=UPI00098DD45C|nr:EEF1A lysine methyltransferase 1-like [Cajanus cajan]